MKHIRLFTPLALLVVLSVALSGCGAAQPQVTAADVIAKMREAMKTTQTAQGMADLSLTINKDGLKTLAQGMMGGSGAPGMPVVPSNKSSDEKGQGMMGNSAAPDMGGKDWTAQLPDSASATIKTWKQAPDKGRIEVQSSTLPGLKGATLVYDGQKVYAYDPAHNTVYTGTPEKMLDRIPAEIKAVMQGTDMQKQVDNLIDAADIKLLGTEKVAGTDAYKLDITPKTDAAARLGLPKMYEMQAGLIIKDLHAVLWVDKSRWVPIKVTVEHPNMGTFTASATQLTLNQPIDASMFVLQVPASAKTVDLDAKMQENSPQSTTITDARAQASKDGWKLLEPSYVPQKATLIEVLRMPGHMGEMTGNTTGNAGAYTLNYSSPMVSFSIMESKTAYEKMLGDGFSGMPGGTLKDVDLRNAKAKAFSPDGGNWTALFWQEKTSGVWVAIHGNLSLDEAVKIAQGLK